jgi:hypothetical protein
VPDRNVARKRRPVDVLFGDRSAAYTDYVIEAPQPVTTVSPPPPVLMLVAEPEPEPPLVVAPSVEEIQLEKAPVAALPKLPGNRPTSSPEPMPDSKTAATQDRISQMYDEVRSQLGATQGIARECMELLLEARIAYSEGDFATAEFYTESVEARLAQSKLSQQSARRPIVWIIGLWNVSMLAAAGAALVASYVLTLTLFGVSIPSQVVLLLRTVAWGVLGAALGSVLGLVRSIRHREYDPANELGYFFKVVAGAAFGGVISIIFQIVAVLGGGIPNLVQLIHVFTYLLALLVGFGQDTLTEFSSGLRN